MVAPRKTGEFVWELPIGTVPGMHVPGRIFASEALMQKAIEDKAVQQVANVATLPGIVSASLAMPDIHWGYGFPIGGVAATDVERGGVISPGGVGFDIGCGVRLLRSDLTYEADVEPRLRALVDLLGDRVPRGVGGRGRMPLRGGEVDQVLREGARFAVERGAGWDQDLESCESGGTLPGAEPDFVSRRAKERGAPQLGSLGAGNHFVEVQVVDEIRDAAAASAMELFQGQVCVMIHSGSRGIGHQTCTDHLRVIDRLQTKLGYALPDRQLACVPFGHEVARSYVGAMGAAGNFALANRQVLADAVRESWALLFGRPPQALGLRLVYDVAHNLAQIEEHLVEGQRRRVCVHRKGATRAFGPGNADLPPRYAAIGQPVIIPGSMGTASFVLAGTAGARDLSFASTCHGAGRAMSRTKAKQKMSGQALREKLEDEGILLARSHWALLSEEAPYAYKSAADVVETCEGVGLSRVVARLRPVAVVKG